MSDSSDNRSDGDVEPPAEPTPVGPTSDGPAAVAPPAEAPAPEGSTPPRSQYRWIITIVGAVILLVLAGVAGWVGSRLDDRPVVLTTPRPSSTAAPSGVGTCDAIAVSNQVLPAIVTVSITTSTGGGTGSGEIVTSDGYVVTNNHVISAAATGNGSISVLYSTGEQVSAELVGRDPRSDLAVLKVTADGDLPTVGWGDSSGLRVGEPVVALGAPLGLSGSVTAGIVSALGRSIPVPADDGETALLADSIQTDASINPGNSGGALVNCDGALIGINTAIATVPNASGESGGGSVGIGFAIPSLFAKSIAEQIIETGKATYPYFSVSVAPVSEGSGLYVAAVVPNGPAAKAGIKAGDVITEVDGAPATSIDALTRVVMTKKAGQSVSVTFTRGGSTNTASITLATPPE
jgi:putative serine protease PepD